MTSEKAWTIYEQSPYHQQSLQILEKMQLRDNNLEFIKQLLGLTYKQGHLDGRESGGKEMMDAAIKIIREKF